jgi:hypothetical protein
MAGVFEHFDETPKDVNFLNNCISLKNVPYHGLKQLSVM